MLVLLILFSLGLKWIDALTSQFYLSKRGISKELNPVVRWVLNKIGISQTISLIMGIYGVVIYPVSLDCVEGKPWAYIIINIMMVGVVINNLRAMKRHKMNFRELFDDTKTRK